ncbi:MAG: transcription antitermination factor NusB [Haliangiales bacterium]
MSMGSRRRARSYALQVLYALDLNPGVIASEAVLDCARRFEIELDGEALAFSNSLVTRVIDNLSELDARIQEQSKNWRLERMSRVDRNVLRLATGELMYSREVPARIVINEAVELAKRFGTSDSPAFVNGILDRMAQTVRARASAEGGDGAGGAVADADADADALSVDGEPSA